MERYKIQYIDIHDTRNGYIEIVDRMRPIHDYLGSGGERVVPLLKSVTITIQQKSTTLEGGPKKLLVHFFSHWNSRDK